MSAKGRYALAKAWFQIAEEIAERGGWICNTARRLYGEDSPLGKAIKNRVKCERIRQSVSVPASQSLGLWLGKSVHGPDGRIARLRFITSEIRRLTS